MSRELSLLAADRRAGKTTQAVAWVSQGERVAGYPGWSRVLVVTFPTGWDLLRREFWGRLNDFDHRVYRLREWVEACGVSPGTEVCVDDLEVAIRAADLRLLPGQLVAATMTTSAWDRQEFREGLWLSEGRG